MIGKTNCYIFSQAPKGTPLSELTEGTLVKANEVGAPVEFYLAKHDYEFGLNGYGRQLIVRKDCYDERQWDPKGHTIFDFSNIDTWLNSTYISLLDSKLTSLIGTTKFFVTMGTGSDPVNSLERSCFLLSASELGHEPKSPYQFNVEGEKLPTADLIKIGYFNGQAVEHWTRTVDSRLVGSVCFTAPSGGYAFFNSHWPGIYSRPCFTLPADARVDDDLNIIV